MLYLVTYTLRPGRQAPAIEQEICNSQSWWHHLDYTWLVITNENVNELYNRLARHFIQTDSLLIVQILPNATSQGWLPQEAWSWFNQARFL
jgi:hypothetical protein